MKLKKRDTDREAPSTMAVLTGPGWTAFTVTPEKERKKKGMKGVSKVSQKAVQGIGVLQKDNHMSHNGYISRSILRLKNACSYRATWAWLQVPWWRRAWPASCRNSWTPERPTCKHPWFSPRGSRCFPSGALWTIGWPHDWARSSSADLQGSKQGDIKSVGRRHRFLDHDCWLLMLNL